ncbi:MAG: hypothetical protein JXA30_11660 [Deltaproteobacteria bacterium]|nr:hypothetical protein [Deltaproteobacteria bacterium]
MSLLKKKRAPARPRAITLRIGCPFCFEWLPAAETRYDLFSVEGCQGGRCQCGAAFVVDETGRLGGQALLDAQLLACDGDMERALKLDANKDFEVKTRNLREAVGKGGRPLSGHGYLEPKIWAIKLKLSE